MPDTPKQPEDRPTVALFVTCLVDLFRPSVGFAAVTLLEQAGCEVVVPEAQTCCGQPAYNSGDGRHAKQLARQVIATFEKFDYVVVPSGSCGGTLGVHYPEMFRDEPNWRSRAERLAERTYELMSFLVDVRAMRQVTARFPAHATYHDACAGLRELGVREQPRRLLQSVERLELVEMRETEVCCGFGGTFCVKYPEISQRMVDNKATNALETGADTLLAGDLGCLFNIAGRMQRTGKALRCYHVAEVLAGSATDDAPIAGEPTS